MQVYNRRRAKEDIDSVYSMGLFHDVNITMQLCEDSPALEPRVSNYKMYGIAYCGRLTNKNKSKS